MTGQRFVSFFGSIGTGKTTAGKTVADLFPQIGFVPESLGDNPYLSRFYDDMHQWGFLSSLEMLAGMACQFQQSDREIVILDNGVRELICFTRVERKLGILSSDEYSTYKKLYHAFLESTPEIDLYVYFSCNIHTQLERIRKRGRTFEQQLSEEFLAALNQEYKDYLESLPAEKLLRIDTDKPLDYEMLGADILSFLNAGS